ncbi:MAG: hypothetical protein ABI142_07505, partial [Bryocella sp.]
MFTKSSCALGLAFLLVPTLAVAASQSTLTEHSGNLAIHANIASGSLHVLHLNNTADHRTLNLGEAFTLVLADGATIRSTQLHAAPLASSSVADMHQELTTQHTAAHHESCLRFTGEALNGTADWCVVAASGNYLRTLLKLTAGA